VFFVNVPIGVAVIVLALRYLPQDRPPADKAQFWMDPAGMVLLAVALLAGMFAIGYMGEKNATPWSPAFVVPSAIAIFAAWRFFHHINRSPHPFIAPRLIHGPGFGPVNLVNAIYGGVTLGAVTLIPLYATNRYRMDALGSGTLLVAQGAAAIGLSVIGALALRRTGYRMPLYIGGAAIAIGMLLLAFRPDATIPPYGWLAGSAFLVGVGAGAISPASRNAGLQLAPRHSSTLAALRSASLQIGPIVTVSIVTAILAASDDPGRTQAWVFIAAALLLVAALPLIRRVPEQHGAW
jgi:hypothetical protein